MKLIGEGAVALLLFQKGLVQASAEREGLVIASLPPSDPLLEFLIDLMELVHLLLKQGKLSLRALAQGGGTKGHHDGDHGHQRQRGRDPSIAMFYLYCSRSLAFSINSGSPELAPLRMSSRSRLVNCFGRITISTRRFFCRPARVSLDSTGRYSP